MIEKEKTQTIRMEQENDRKTLEMEKQNLVTTISEYEIQIRELKAIISKSRQSQVTETLIN